jgi:hypothetical protein
MDTIKRIELVVPTIEVNEILKRLEKMGVTKYSIIRHVVGRGASGASLDDLDDQLSSTYILTTCQSGQEDGIFWELQPVLKKFGGMCLVSDAVCYKC